ESHRASALRRPHARTHRPAHERPAHRAVGPPYLASRARPDARPRWFRQHANAYRGADRESSIAARGLAVASAKPQAAERQTMSLRVTLIQGGEIGHDLVPAVQRVLDAAGVSITWDNHVAGQEAIK